MPKLDIWGQSAPYDTSAPFSHIKGYTFYNTTANELIAFSDVNGLDMDYYPDKWITGLQLILGLLHSQKRLALVRLTLTGYPSTNI
jgi:hypothetical protein